MLTNHPGCLLMEQFWGLPLEILIYSASGVGSRNHFPKAAGETAVQVSHPPLERHLHWYKAMGVGEAVPTGSSSSSHGPLLTSVVSRQLSAAMEWGGGGALEKVKVPTAEGKAPFTTHYF